MSLRIAALTVCTLLGVPLIAGWFWMSPVRSCRHLSPGTTTRQLVDALGSPKPLIDSRGRLWWAFDTPAIMSDGMRAQVDDRTGRVNALWCDDDSRATWSTVPELAGPWSWGELRPSEGAPDRSTGPVRP